MADSVCTRTPAQSPDTIFDQWADEGAAARAAQSRSQAANQPGDLSAKNGGKPCMSHAEECAARARARAAHIRSCSAPLQRVYQPSTTLERERQARVLYRGVAGLLDAASITAEDHDHFHESDRFLHAAFEFAEARADGEHKLQTLTNDAYTVATLLKGARSVPGDTESMARRSLIDAAGALLFQIIGPEEGEIEGFIDGYPCGSSAFRGAA